MHVCESRGAIIYMRVKLGKVVLTAGWSYFDLNWQRYASHGWLLRPACSLGDKRSVS